MAKDLQTSCEPLMPFDVLTAIWEKCSVKEKVKMMALSRQMKCAVEPCLQHALALVHFVCHHHDVPARQYSITVNCACPRETFQLIVHHKFGETDIRNWRSCKGATLICTAVQETRLATVLVQHLLKQDRLVVSWWTSDSCDLIEYQISCQWHTSSVVNLETVSQSGL
mmetsp:Transcript_17965/g.61238  ORF Transcript_17965/g.61238 Transcript_17965/m.61238 type:complete len:168 (-) Transcript_17965:620-1123(-)